MLEVYRAHSRSVLESIVEESAEIYADYSLVEQIHQQCGLMFDRKEYVLFEQFYKDETPIDVVAREIRCKK